MGPWNTGSAQARQLNSCLNYSDFPGKILDLTLEGRGVDWSDLTRRVINLMTLDVPKT